MKTINLTKGYKAIVDDEMYDYLNQWNWRAHVKPNGQVYAVREDWNGGNRRNILMHRLIMGTLGTKQQVDHINHDALDNTKGNLRIVSNQQNQMNSTSRTGSSKYKGVSWNKAINKWTAHIKENGIKHHIGCFESQEEAAKAYDTEAIRRFGEYADPNFKELANV